MKKYVTKVDIIEIKADSLIYYLFLQLRLLAQRAKEKRLEFGKSNGGSRKKADLGDVTKWNLGDVVQFGQVLRQYEADLSTLKELRDAQYQALRELQSNMLKGMRYIVVFFLFSWTLILSLQLELGGKKSSASTKRRMTVNLQRC